MSTYETQEETTLQTYTADPAHSQVGFAVSHMGFSTVRGQFEEFEATIRMDPDDIESLQAEATINTASIRTGDEKRDNHLRSEDFFAAESHPTMEFQSTGVKDVSGNSFTLVGDLTIRGKTHEVELDAEFLGEGQDPWGGMRVGFESSGTIDRTAYGLTWNQVLESGGVLVGKKVNIELDVQAALEEEE